MKEKTAGTSKKLSRSETLKPSKETRRTGSSAKPAVTMRPNEKDTGDARYHEETVPHGDGIDEVDPRAAKARSKESFRGSLKELNFESPETCPNCGQYVGNDATCPNCGAVLYNEDEMNLFDEEGDLDG